MANEALIDDAMERLGRKQGIEAAGQDSDVNEAMARLEMREKNISPEQFAATFVGQESLGKPGAGVGTRALLSLFGDTFEEQKAAFESFNPKGELIKVPVSGLVIYRNNPSEKFRKVDAGFTELFGFSLTDAGKEVLGDVADVAGEIPNVVGEVAVLFAFRKPGAKQFLSDLLRVGGGGATGEALQQTAQTIKGTQRETGGEQLEEIVGASGQSLIGFTLGAGVAGGINVVRQAGVLQTLPGAQRAMRSAERLGTRSLLPNQASDVPIIGALGSQSRALSTRISRYIADQEARTAKAVKGLTNNTLRRRFVTDTVKAFNRAKDDIVDLAVQQTRTAASSFRKGGRALQKGVQAWWKTSGNDVDTLYATARSVQEPRFKIVGLKKNLDDIKQGVVGQTEEGSRITLNDLDPELLRVIDDIDKLDPNLPSVTLENGRVVGPTEQLRALEKRLHDLTLAGPEGPREAQAVAARVKGLIKGVLDDPANASPEFRNAWKAARTSAAKRFETREKLAVIDVVRSETPTAMARKLAKPGKIDDLVVLKKIIPDKEFRQFTDAFKNDLFSDPGNITKRLAEFDSKTLNVLMSANEQAAMRQAGVKIDRLFSSGVQNAMRQQRQTRGFIRDIFDTNDTARINAFFDLVTKNGGKKSPFGRSSRAAIIDEIWRRSKVDNRGVEVLDFNKLQSTLTDFGERGLLKFLDFGDVRILKSAEIVQDFSRVGADAGTSLQRASAVATLRGGGLEGLITVAENIGVGRMFTMQSVQKILLGKGRKDPVDFIKIKAMGAALGTIISDTESQKDLGEDTIRLFKGITGFST